MDRDVYKSFAETMRMSSFRIILAIKAGYYDMLCAFLLDASDAFQSTKVVDPSTGVQDVPDLYCWPAPGFEKRNEKGERMACRLKVLMQGRIDATRGFNDRLMKILIRGGAVRLLWDRQMVVYHHGPHEGTDAPLIQVLTDIQSATDTPAQQPPVGYCILGWHVDDGTGLACDVGHHLIPSENRVVNYLRGLIEVTYATTLTGWHGNKALGFTITCDDKKKTVVMSAPDSLLQVYNDLVGDEDILDAGVGHGFGFTDLGAGDALRTGGELELSDGRGFVRLGVGAQVFTGLAEVLGEFGDIVFEGGEVD